MSIQPNSVPVTRRAARALLLDGADRLPAERALTVEVVHPPELVW